jgi:acyl-[acyl-carrier-protein] desaturase
MTLPTTETLAKVEVLADLEPVVHDLMDAHEAKRVLWFPSELLAPAPDTDPDRHLRELRARAEGITLPMRVALALNLLTEEGLPHFHRCWRPYLGGDTFWAKWTNLWTAEEDRHGAVLHDYTRDSRILDNPVLERMQFEYLKAGFEPEWDKDPYRVFVYTTLQERATQVSHANTGSSPASTSRPSAPCSPTWPRRRRGTTVLPHDLREVLKRDPNRALASAAEIMPSIDMPGVSMPHFREMADVIRRAGIYGPRDYLKIVEEQIRFWASTRSPGSTSRASARRRRSSASRAPRARGRRDGGAQPRQVVLVRRGVRARVPDDVTATRRRRARRSPGGAAPSRCAAPR